MSLGAGTAVPCPYKGKMRPGGLGAVKRRPYNSEATRSANGACSRSWRWGGVPDCVLDDSVEH